VVLVGDGEEEAAGVTVRVGGRQQATEEARATQGTHLMINGSGTKHMSLGGLNTASLRRVRHEEASGGGRLGGVEARPPLWLVCMHNPVITHQ
jgi:hypothetical protein